MFYISCILNGGGRHRIHPGSSSSSRSVTPCYLTSKTDISESSGGRHLEPPFLPSSSWGRRRHCRPRSAWKEPPALQACPGGPRAALQPLTQSGGEQRGRRASQQQQQPPPQPPTVLPLSLQALPATGATWEEAFLLLLFVVLAALPLRPARKVTAETQARAHHAPSPTHRRAGGGTSTAPWGAAGLQLSRLRGPAESGQQEGLHLGVSQGGHRPRWRQGCSVGWGCVCVQLAGPGIRAQRLPMAHQSHLSCLDNGGGALQGPSGGQGGQDPSILLVGQPQPPI